MFTFGPVETFSTAPSQGPQDACGGAPECNKPVPENPPGTVGICSTNVISPCNQHTPPIFLGPPAPANQPPGGSASALPNALTCTNCKFKIGAIVAVTALVWWFL